MLTNNIDFKNFNKKKPNKKIYDLFKKLIKEDNEILNSLSKNYKDSYSKKNSIKIQKNFSFYSNRYGRIYFRLTFNL